MKKEKEIRVKVNGVRNELKELRKALDRTNDLLSVMADAVTSLAVQTNKNNDTQTHVMRINGATITSSGTAYQES